jgi:hypothetical protein
MEALKYKVLLGRPPWGVLLLVLGNLALAIRIGIPVLRVLVGPEGNWNQLTVVVTPFTAALLGVFLLSSIGTWLGHRRARNLMISALAMLTGIMIWQSAAIMDNILCITNDIHKIPTADYWRISMGLRASAWLAVNVWYFYGWRESLAFYTQQQDKVRD